MKLVLSLFALVATISFAGAITTTGGTSSVSTYHGTDTETILWSQLPTGSAMASQNFTDEPTYDAGIADDFEFATETTINKIRWWGGYWGGTNPLPIVAPIEIYLYMDDGSDSSPTLPQHTSAIDSWMVDATDYTEVADGSNYVCEYVFPSSIVFDPGQKYWFEVRKAMDYAGNGQYGWIQSSPISLSSCVQGFDGLAVVWWTPQSIDAAFELIFDDTVSLTRSTWAGIKTNF